MNEINEEDLKCVPTSKKALPWDTLAGNVQTTISAAVSSVCSADIVPEPRGADIELLKRMQTQMEEETLDDIKKGKVDFAWLQKNVTLSEFSHSNLEKIAKAFFDLEKAKEGFNILLLLPENNLFRIENLLYIAIAWDLPSKQVILSTYLVPALQGQEMDVIQKELERGVSRIGEVRVNRILAHIAWAFDNTTQTVYERYMRALEECEDIGVKEWLAEYLVLQWENEQALELLCSLFDRDRKEYAHLLPIIVSLAVSVKSPNILKYVGLLRKETPEHAIALCHYYLECGKTIPEKMQAFQIHAEYMDKILENPKVDLGYHLPEELKKRMKRFALERAQKLPEIDIDPGNSEDVEFERVPKYFSYNLFALRSLALDFSPDIEAITAYWWRLYQYIMVSLEVLDAISSDPENPKKDLQSIQDHDFIKHIAWSLNLLYPGAFLLPDQKTSDYFEYVSEEILPDLLKQEAELTVRKYDAFVDTTKEMNIIPYGALCSIIAETLRLVEDENPIDEKNPEKAYLPSYAFDLKELRALTGGGTFVAPWNMNTGIQ